MRQFVKYVLFAFSFAFLGCQGGYKEVKEDTQQYEWYGLEVTASAYNSVSWQTDGTPTLAAWGDTLSLDVNSVAVSRDLLKLGLQRNTMVRIDTFPDTFYVKDKMHRRWRKRIDIYMGKDVKAAREWGRKKIQICYAVPIDSVAVNE